MSIHAAAPAAISHSTNANKQPPAQAVRAALTDQPELAEQPFGKLVSDFARGIPLPSSPTPDELGEG